MIEIGLRWNVPLVIIIFCVYHGIDNQSNIGNKLPDNSDFIFTQTYNSFSCVDKWLLKGDLFSFTLGAYMHT